MIRIGIREIFIVFWTSLKIENYERTNGTDLVEGDGRYPIGLHGGVLVEDPEI